MFHTLTVPAAALLLLTACASGGSLKQGPKAPAEPTTRVQVTNNNWADMTVYLENAGMKVRLGTVTSMGKGSFRVPRAFLNSTGTVRLIADPVGSRSVHTTSPVQVWPGQLVDFTIENHLAVSSVAVWSR